MPSKILLIARDFPPLVGGISTYIRQMYDPFLPHELEVIAFYTPGCEEHDRSSRWKVIRTGRMWRLLPGKTAIVPLLIASLVHLARNGRDIRAIHADQVQSGFVAFICSRIWGLPYCVFGYGMEINTADRLGLKRAVYRAARRVFAISHYSIGLLRQRAVRRDRIQLFTPGVFEADFTDALGVTTEEARARLGLSSDRAILLSVGRLDRSSQYKGVDSMIEALPDVLRQVTNLEYWIVGDGTDIGRLRSLARRLDLGQQVRFAGAVTQETKGLYYAACDVFVLPNRVEMARGGERTEGFGIVFIEAALFGKPSVGGLGGATHAVVDGMTGITTDPTSRPAIAASVLQLLKNPDLAARLGRQGRARALSEFDVKRISSAFYSDCRSSA